MIADAQLFAGTYAANFKLRTLAPELMRYTHCPSREPGLGSLGSRESGLRTRDNLPWHQPHHGEIRAADDASLSYREIAISRCSPARSNSPMLNKVSPRA